MTVQTHLPPSWRQRTLNVVGAPASTGNLEFLDAQARAEGGSARWNPLNCVYPLPGATDYNSVGVKNYARATEGVCATALTLVDGDFPGLLGDFQSGKFTAVEIVNRNRDEIRHWGTDPDLMLKILS